MNRRLSSVACPRCGAEPGTYCVYPSGKSIGGYHAVRRNLVHQRARVQTEAAARTIRQEISRRPAQARPLRHDFSTVIAARRAETVLAEAERVIDSFAGLLPPEPCYRCGYARTGDHFAPCPRCAAELQEGAQ